MIYKDMKIVCHATCCLTRLSHFVSWQCSLCGVGIGLSENGGSLKSDVELVEHILLDPVAVSTSLCSLVTHIQEHNRWIATLLQLSAVPVQDAWLYELPRY